MKNQTVERPNKASSGALSGHAAGEPFEKKVYHKLKEKYPSKIFKQYEYLNDLYLKNPKHITTEQRYALFNSPTALFLLSRGDKATKEWTPTSIFEEKQNDTADILFYENGFYDIIDVKTRNKSKDAQPPNIISAYKLARMCAVMIDNEEYDNINIDYVEVDWIEQGDNLKCTDAHHGDLFKANPDTLYINWAAAMQVQFHVSNLDQSWKGSREEWARHYLKMFVTSADARCQKMREQYVLPFLKYIKEYNISTETKIQESTSLRYESERLLEVAKKAVEIAISEDEDSALQYIKEQNAYNDIKRSEHVQYSIEPRQLDMAAE